MSAHLSCELGFTLARFKIDSNGCLLISYEHGCISHMLSLVSTLKLKVHNDEDGYLRYVCWSDKIDTVKHASFDKLVVIRIIILL